VNGDYSAIAKAFFPVGELGTWPLTQIVCALKALEQFLSPNYFRPITEGQAYLRATAGQ